MHSHIKGQQTLWLHQEQCQEVILPVFSPGGKHLEMLSGRREKDVLQQDEPSDTKGPEHLPCEEGELFSKETQRNLINVFEFPKGGINKVELGKLHLNLRGALCCFPLSL